MTEYYIEIEGNVEEDAGKLPTTLFCSYRTDRETTVIKAFANNGSYSKAIQNVYSEIGEIITFEEL